MNLTRLALFFRHRLQAPGALPLIISVFALALSCANFYRNFLYREYALSVQATDGDFDVFSHKATLRLVLVNSGNREVALRDLQMWTIQTSPPGMYKFRAQSLYEPPLPIAIPAQSLKFIRLESDVKPGHWMPALDLPDTNHIESDVDISFDLGMDAIATDGAGHSSQTSATIGEIMVGYRKKTLSFRRLNINQSIVRLLPVTDWQKPGIQPGALR